MLPEKIQALFSLIDFLDQHKKSYIEKYIPLCHELEELDSKRSALKPNRNYRDKQQYDLIQEEIKGKFSPIRSDIYQPVTNKLIALGIWSGDDTCASIWNNNMSDISDFKRSFSAGDVAEVMNYKRKYLSFRSETNSNFLCLSMVLNGLDEIFKELFDFFKDKDLNEFESFEAKTIKVDSIADAITGLAENAGKNVRYSIPTESLQPQQPNRETIKHHSIKNEIVMGDKIIVGDISNNSGQIIIGKDIKIADSTIGKQATADKIEELIQLIRQEQNIDEQQKQSLITNFDKVKEEIAEEKPDKSKIFKWLATTKGILENLVLTHHVTEAVRWVYENLNFVAHHI